MTNARERLLSSPVTDPSNKAFSRLAMIPALERQFDIAG